ncbi:MAG: hotdog fold thioesterase [Caldilineae bacterium]|nr:MAG: hotdog fold thioesterase [Caldilineae bacterium]
MNAASANTLVAHLGIEFVEVGADSITARMPVDHRTVQPFGLLHGGASVSLAETLGSMASFALVDPAQYTVVGLEINANHVRSVREGWVTGVVTPIHVGRRTHIWQIRITDEQGRLVCISRLTVAVIKRDGSREV